MKKGFVMKISIHLLEWRKHEKEKADCVRRTEQGRIAEI